VSNALAIAGVTAVLKDLLDNGLKAFKLSDIVGGDVTVSALPPDKISVAAVEDPTQLNLFLYQCTPNQGWRNVGLPTRNANGERVSDNPLALNLHYLLTAYGAKDFYPEIILGHAMQLLHETPVLTRDSIRKALSPASPPDDFPKALATSELADQIEQLRISPEILNTEEISKLWAAMSVHYRPTAAYQVTVVLIDSSRPVKSALPVAARNVYVVPFDQPSIDTVTSDRGDEEPITAASTLLIKGKQLRGEITRVMIGGSDLTAAVSELNNDQIKLLLPSPLPAGMRAGIQIVQVVHLRMMGTPAVPHSGVESNVEAFVLRPVITAHAPTNISDKTVDGVTFRSGKIQIDFNPKIGKLQRVVLLFNELNPPGTRPARGYSFKTAPGNGIVDPNTETASITIAFKDVIPGDYLIRAQVDGAESLLAVDASGKYATPSETI
jgi:Pvc16 N-terminal domain